MSGAPCKFLTDVKDYFISLIISNCINIKKMPIHLVTD